MGTYDEMDASEIERSQWLPEEPDLHAMVKVLDALGDAER